jgi:hypothetical protein
MACEWNEAEHFDEIHDPQMWLTATALKYFVHIQGIKRYLSHCLTARLQSA